MSGRRSRLPPPPPQEDLPVSELPIKRKLDENLPERLVAGLHALGHDVDTAHIEHLTGRDDNEVWQAAPRFLITQDHAGPMLVRFVQPGRNAAGLTTSRTPTPSLTSMSIRASVLNKSIRPYRRSLMRGCGT
jgi:hypothetical protein